ncbi:hypothetical protein ACVBGC_22910 [Burkholderia stagnalis]
MEPRARPDEPPGSVAYRKRHRADKARDNADPRTGCGACASPAAAPLRRPAPPPTRPALSS